MDNVEEMDKFLEKYNFPNLDQEEIENLNRPITSTEIETVIRNLLGRLSYLSLPFFGTLHSNGNIFPVLLCFSLLFFSQLFVRPPQTTILLFGISFSWGWF